MMMVLVFAAALQAEPLPSSSALSPVSERVLKYLLDGVYLEPVGVAIYDRAQFFFPGGRYVLQGRARSEGHYRVSGSLICTQIGTYAENCFRVLTNNGGRFFVDSDITKRNARVSEVRFLPVLNEH